MVLSDTLFLFLALLPDSLTLNANECDMDIVDRGPFAITCNCFVRNNNSDTPPRVCIIIDAGLAEVLIATDSLFPWAFDATISIICITPGDADLNQFNPNKWF